MISTSIQVFNFHFVGSFTNPPLAHGIGSCKKRTNKNILYGLNILALELHDIYQRCFLNTHMVRMSTRTKHVIFGPSYLWHTNQTLLNAPWVICILARLSAQGPWGCFRQGSGNPSNRTTGITMTLPHNWRKKMCLWQDALWYSSSWCHLFDSLDFMYTITNKSFRIPKYSTNPLFCKFCQVVYAHFVEPTNIRAIRVACSFDLSFPQIDLCQPQKKSPKKVDAGTILSTWGC